MKNCIPLGFFLKGMTNQWVDGVFYANQPIMISLQEQTPIVEL
jgi:hypothetical protein